jgi:S1-C subfamily serine protease
VVKAAPAVVNIFTSGSAKGQKHPFMDDPLFRRFFGDSLGEGRRTASLGSGVIVSPKGYVLTNNHVVEAMDQIEVLLADSQTRLRAKVVGSDPETDLAVLKVERDDLPAITFGALDAVRIGDVVLAIGNPFGVGQTVTMGIVSALGRTGLGVSTYENFIQTDAAINQGNSGGALVDTAGNLIGINTVILSGSGGSIGIASRSRCPPRTVMAADHRRGSITRGYIGIQAQEVTRARQIVQDRGRHRRPDCGSRAQRPCREGRRQTGRRADRGERPTDPRPRRDARSGRRARAGKPGDPQAAPQPGRARRVRDGRQATTRAAAAQPALTISARVTRADASSTLWASPWGGPPCPPLHSSI